MKIKSKQIEDTLRSQSKPFDTVYSKALEINGDGSNVGELRLMCEQNSHGISLQSPPNSATATYTLTLPTTAPSSSVNGYVISTNATGQLAWVEQSGGGWNYSPIVANTTAQVGYHYSCGAGNETFTLTLPASGVSAGQEVRVKNMGTGTITIARNGNNIDGVASDYSLDVQYSAVTLTADGNDNWEII